MRSLILALSLVPTLAVAQAPAMQSPQPDMVLLPRWLAETAAQWIAAPNATDAVQLFIALQACLADNPIAGVTHREGPDQCPAVTRALAAQAQGLADAKKPAAKPN